MRMTPERGQSTVEFALVAPVLLLVLFMIWQGGVAFFDDMTVSQAARDGARKGIVAGSCSTCVPSTAVPAAAIAAAQASAANGLAPSKTTVTATCAVDCSTGDKLTVQVTYPYSFGFGVLSFGGTLTSTTTMTIE
jgi:Flp pilus assembly protein TadG